MSPPHADLTDREAVNAAVGFALRPKGCGAARCRVVVPLVVGHYGPCRCPDYLADEPALNDEMRDKLLALPDAWSVGILWPRRGRTANVRVTVYREDARLTLEVGGVTEAGALILALDAAGVVKLEA